MKSNLPAFAGKLPARCASGIACLLGVWLAVVSPQACAQAINFTTMGSTSGIPGEGTPTGAHLVLNGKNDDPGWMGIINITVNSFNGQTVSPAQTVPTFCIQMTVNINPSTNYNYVVASLNQGNGGTLSATSVRDLTTLYNLFYQGNSASKWTTAQAAAFQLDVWKIVEDPGNYSLTSTSGKLYITGWNDAASTQAASWLATVSSTVVTTNTNGYTPVALTSATYQNLLFTQYIENHLVPFRVEAWPGAAFLGILAFLRVQRKLKATC